MTHSPVTSNQSQSPSPQTPPLIAVVGETASGKTAASIKLAQKVDGEIICADSRTVYKQMNIGTAKPTEQEQMVVKHHLIDVVNPDESFSVAQFKALAQKCIHEIYERGKIPIMVGGSGLYIDSVLYNFTFSSEPDQAYRDELEQMSDVELTTLLHTKNIDQSTLNTKNRRHVIRAIERGEEPPINNKLRKNTFVCGLKLEKEVLTKRITQRVQQMFKDGFLDEVKTLSDIYGWESEAMSGIGYRVARAYLEGGATEEEVQQAFIQRDLSLAKRQRTWFKRNEHIQWYQDDNQLIRDAVAFIEHL